MAARPDGRVSTTGDVSLRFPRQGNRISNGSSKPGSIIASTARAVVKILNDLRCTNCAKLFTAVSPPLTGFCDHLFCQSCAVAAGSDTRGQLHSCKRCGPVHMVSGGEFAEQKLLKDFLTYVDSAGYMCTHCNRFHPRYNTVVFQKENATRYSCVWCASRQNTKDQLQLVQDDKHRVSGTGERLSSIDLTFSTCGSALLQCCYCSEPLVKSSWRRAHKIVTQSCGHYRHESCKGSSGGGAFCNYCSKHVDGRLLPAPATTFFKGMETLSGEILRCKNCKKDHPIGNVYDKVTSCCMWCTLEENSRHVA